MPSAKQLRKWAAMAERDRIRWQAEGDKWHAHARIAERQRDQWTREAEEMDALGTTSDLHSRSQHASMNDVNDTARLNMSRSNSDDPFVKACRAEGLTQNDVAKRLKIPRSLLSMYRAGVRRIPQDRAEAIEALTGWKATPKNWPGGILAAD